MIKFEDTYVVGFKPTIRGMRNPKNSWDKSDTWFIDNDLAEIGERDKKLMESLAKAGPSHAKYRRMLVVYVDITAPLYWWKEADTYKVGTVADSCSTMHKIHAKEFELSDFSTEHLDADSLALLGDTIRLLNKNRDAFNGSKVKDFWWQMIQMLPTSFNQKRTVMLNYEVLANIYDTRRGHKLDEWHEFRKWIEELPESWIITGGNNDEESEQD